MPDYQDEEFLYLENDIEIDVFLKKYILKPPQLIDIISKESNTSPFDFLYNNKN